MDIPRVDVIIPTIGRPALAQAILAAQLQTYPRCRAVVIADGPNAMAMAIYEMVADTDAIYRETPRRYGHGDPVREWWWNRDECSDFLKPLDDDDWMCPTCVATMMAAMDADVSLVTCYGVTTFCPNGQTEAQRARISGGGIQDAGTGSWLMRRAALLGLRYEQRENSDKILARELAKRGRVATVAMPLYHYNGYRTNANRSFDYER